MVAMFSKLRVGEPVCHEALSVFPLFTDTSGEIEYRLSEEALADESVTVEEINESGSVPELLVENKGDTRVLFLEGEELIGAKQNRILNTSVLIAAGSRTKLPVSCVEQGRWRYKTKTFGSSGSQSPSKIRRALKGSVTQSVKRKMGYRSDQGKVWNQVACLHSAMGVDSDTAAMSDAFEAHRDQLEDFRERLRYVEGAAGVAVAVGDKVVAVDVFDKPATCAKVWDRLLTGVVFDALEAGPTEKHAGPESVERVLNATHDADWHHAEAVGEGAEYRAELGADQASALTFQGSMIHGSLVSSV